MSKVLLLVYLNRSKQYNCMFFCYNLKKLEDECIYNVPNA